MHSDAFKQAAAAPSNAFRPALADDFGSSSNGFAHGERARAQTVSAVGDPPNHFGRAPAQRAVTGLPLDSFQAGAASGLGSLGLSSYFDGHVGAQHSSFASGVRSSSSYPPQALNDVDRQKHQLASFLSQPGPRSGSFTPAPVNYSQQHQQHHHAGSANGFGAGSHQGFNGGGGAAFEVDRSGGSAYGGGGNDQLADIIASLKRQQQQPQQRLHANGGARDHGFAVNVDHTRPQLSSFASASSYGSTAGLYSPGLRSPTPYSAGMGMPPDGGANNGSDVLTRLQAIRFLHPGVFGNHGDSSARDAHARQTPPHLDSAGLAAVGQHHPARANMAGGGADPASLARFLGATGLRHGINPVVMDPALQQYLLEHNLPLDGVSVTNKKAQLYKTEKCRASTPPRQLLTSRGEADRHLLVPLLRLLGEEHSRQDARGALPVRKQVPGPPSCPLRFVIAEADRRLARCLPVRPRRPRAPAGPAPPEVQDASALLLPPPPRRRRTSC